MVKYLKTLFLSMSLVVSLSSCSIVTNPYFIQAVVIVGGYVARTTIAEVIEQGIDRLFEYLFDTAADKTAEVVPIQPLANNLLLGRKIGDHEYLIEGNRYGRSSSITFKIPTEIILFQRQDRNSPWELTPESRQEILKRMDIAGAQLSLIDLGYDPSEVDGLFGKKTKRALRKFQQDRELLPSGELNELTRQMLFMR